MTSWTSEPGRGRRRGRSGRGVRTSGSKGGGEEFSRGWAFYGEAGPIEKDFLGGRCPAGEVEGAFESSGPTEEGAA